MPEPTDKWRGLIEPIPKLPPFPPLQLTMDGVGLRNIDSPFDEFLGAQGGGGSGAQSHPLQLYKATVSGVVKIRVRYGSVWGAAPPEVQGGSAPVDITPSDGLQVWARVTVDAAGLPTARAIQSGSSVPSNTSTLGYFLIGQVSVVGTTVTPMNAVTHSLNGEMCAGLFKFWGV